MKKSKITGEKFKKWIEDHGILKKKVAQLIGLNDDSFYNLLAGNYTPGLKIALKIQSLTRNKIKADEWVEIENIDLYGSTKKSKDEKKE